MKNNLTIILGVLIVLLVIGITLYVLNAEGIITFDKLENILQNGLDKIKDLWHTITADPVTETVTEPAT